MANLTAINNVAQQLAPRFAPAPGAASAVSNSVGIASTIASAASKSAGAAAGAGGAAAGGAGGATGVLGFLSAAAPFLAIGAVAAPIVSNLFQCGTVSQVGCQKVSDSKALTNIRMAALQIAYAVEMGQISPADGIQQLQQIANQAVQAFQNPQRSWVGASTFYEPCGSFTNNGASESGAPCASQAAQVIQTGQSITGPQTIQNYINWIQSRPNAATSAIDAGVNQVANAVASSGSSSLLLLLGLAVGGYLLLG